MDWQALSAIGEATGAVAVVISVLYLAHQIRIQSAETRLAAIHEVSVGFREGIAATFLDPQLARVFHLGKDGPEHLDPAERIQFIALVQRNWRVWEDVFYQYRDGRLNEPLWRSMERQYSALLVWPGVQWVWSIRRDFYTPEFGRYVDTVEPKDHPI